MRPCATFNTSGPVAAGDHYCIPPLDRVNLANIQRLIDQERYFVLHAPRQTDYDALGDESLEEIWPGVLAKRDPDSALREALTRWARAVVPKPLVLRRARHSTLVRPDISTQLESLPRSPYLLPSAFVKRFTCPGSCPDGR